MRNVARCWTYETAVLLDQEVSEVLPFNNYFEYYGPDYRLHITPSNMENQNSKKHLDGILEKLHNMLDGLENVPGLQATTIQSLQPPDSKVADEEKMDVDENTERKAAEVSA